MKKEMERKVASDLEGKNRVRSWIRVWVNRGASSLGTNAMSWPLVSPSVWLFCVVLHATVKEHLGIWSVLGTWTEGMNILTLHGLSISYTLPPICLALPLFPTSLKRPSICRAAHQSATGPGVRRHELWFTPGRRLRCHLPSLCPSFLICKVRGLS